MDGLKTIIEQLEQQRKAIERALLALREVEGVVGRASEPIKTNRPERKARKRRITPEGRRRLAEAMKRRWAVKRTAAQAKMAGSRRKSAK